MKDINWTNVTWLVAMGLLGVCGGLWLAGEREKARNANRD